MVRTVRSAFTTAVLVAVAAVLVPLGAEAQVQQGQEPPPEPDAEELTRFANGLIDITEIQEEMEQELSNVQEAEEANAIQEAANEQMVDALAENELTPERYSEIAMLLNTNEELNAEFEEIYDEVLAERDGARLA